MADMLCKSSEDLWKPRITYQMNDLSSVFKSTGNPKSKRIKNENNKEKEISDDGNGEIYE